MSFDLQSTKDKWSQVDLSEIDLNFYSFPPIRERSCKLIFGESSLGRRDWCEYWTIEKYLKEEKIPFERCLSLCCGHGGLERTLSKLNLASEFVGIDIAPGAVDNAKKKAHAEGFNNIQYFVADLNEYDFPLEHFDIIWCNGALHHISEIDLVVGKLKKSLKNPGFLIANDYVGSKYQQLSLRQQEIINAVKHLLPNDLCNKLLSPTYDNSIVARAIRKIKRSLKLKSLEDPLPLPNEKEIFSQIYKMPSEESFLLFDPSESVSSHLVIPSLKKYFKDLDIKYYHGSILCYALDSKFYHSFDSENIMHIQLLEMLFLIEEALIQTGELASDNAHIICKK